MLEKFKLKYRMISPQLKASIWFLACSVLQKGISTLTTPIFTRLLSTEEYGQYNVFCSWYDIVGVFVTLRLYYGVYTQGLVKFEDIRNQYSAALQGLTATMVLVWSGIYFLFQDFWNRLFNLNTNLVLAMLLMCWTTAIFSFWAAEQRVRYAYKKLVFLTIIVSILKPLVGIILVCNSEQKVAARIWGLVVVEFICYIGLFISQMIKGRYFFSSNIWKYALRFNIPLIPHYLSQTLLNSADRIMIERMSGADAAGKYSLAYSISLIMTLFNTALSQTISPWIYQKIKSDNVEEIDKITYPSMVLIAVVNILLICFAPEIIYIFAPGDYYDAVKVIPPIAMSVFFMFLYNLFSCFEFYFEKTSFIAISTCVAAGLNILLNYLFIGIWGYHAAAYTTLLCYVVYASMHYMFMHRICKKRMNGKKCFSAQKIMCLSAVFICLGLLISVTYASCIVRYLFVFVLLLSLFGNRKKVWSYLSALKQN